MGVCTSAHIHMSLGMSRCAGLAVCMVWCACPRCLHARLAECTCVSSCLFTHVEDLCFRMVVSCEFVLLCLSLCAVEHAYVSMCLCLFLHVPVCAVLPTALSWHTGFLSVDLIQTPVGRPREDKCLDLDPGQALGA